ncbi:MAG: hypothetical protein ACRCUY_09660, partial [Thermoguttaceae bacterium]
INPETRRPENSLYHVNQFQQNTGASSLWLNGEHSYPLGDIDEDRSNWLDKTVLSQKSDVRKENCPKKGPAFFVRCELSKFTRKKEPDHERKEAESTTQRTH